MHRLIMMFIACCWAMLPVASVAQVPPPPKFKVGFIYTGPVGDHGWSYQHDQGRKAVEVAFPGKVETVFLENVAEGADAERAINQLVRQGCRLVFLTSFSFGDAVHAASRKYQNTKFEHITGAKSARNISLFNARFYEGRYIAGQIAGRMSETGVIGYIASFPIPEVYQGINAFMLGAQSVNPGIKLQVVWTGSWYLPTREAEAARELIAGNVDIITQHTDSPAALQIAEQNGLKAFGQASDMIEFAPNAQLTAIIDNWAPYYIERVRAAMDGKWRVGDVWTGLDRGTVKMAPYTNMPDEVKAMASATEAAIREGRFHPFKGPLHDQSGKERIPAGEAASDDILKQMDWFVRGITAKPPEK
jgi:simple sugar transport system substrate-binding protein